MHAGGGLLGDAADVLGDLRVPAGLGLQPRLDGGEQDLFLLVGRLVEKGGIAILGANPEMDEEGGVAAVVEDHVRRAAVGPLEDVVGVLPIVLEALAFEGEHGDAGGGDRGCCVVLRRVDVAGGPADIGAERGKRLDQHRGLDGHVQGACDARALERLLRGIFLAHRHEPRHLGLGDVDFLAAPGGEANVLDVVVHAVTLRIHLIKI